MAAAGHWHSWQQCQELSLLNLCLSVDLLDHELAWCVDDAVLGTLWRDSAIRLWQVDASAVDKLTSLGEELRRVCHQQHATSVGLVLQWLNTLVTALPQVEQGQQADPVVRQLRLHLRQQLAHDWTLKELAATVDLDRSYCGRRFLVVDKALQWLARQRCEQAAIALITTDDASQLTSAAALAGLMRIIFSRLSSPLRHQPAYLPPAICPTRPPGTLSR